MTYTVEGKIVRIDVEPRKVSSKLEIRSLILRIPSNRVEGRDEVIEVQFVNANVCRLNGFKAKQRVRVEFALSGREWDGRVFTNLDGLRCVKL